MVRVRLRSGFRHTKAAVRLLAEDTHHIGICMYIIGIIIVTRYGKFP